MARSSWPLTEEMRREPRHAADFSAQLLGYRYRREVTVVDLSRNGAMLKLDDPPMRGDELVFKKDGVEVVATVAWARDDSCGVSFHRPIELASLLRQGRATRGLA